MAKRFINTDIFSDTWFMDLPQKYKLFWMFLITRCNHAGLWQVNFREASFYIGFPLEPVECERILNGRLISTCNGKYWFLPSFISFQYGDKLNPSSNVHRSIIETLNKYNLLEAYMNYAVKSNESMNKEGSSNPSARVIDKAKDTDKDKIINEEKNKKDEVKADNSHPLKDWIAENAPRVNRLKLPLTSAECEKLLDDFGENIVREVLLDMQNYKKLLASYESTYLTVRKWIKLRQERDSSSGRKIFAPAADTSTGFRYFDPSKDAH